MKIIRDIQSIEELNNLAKALAKEVFSGFLVCLEGDLGAGKTTFTKLFGKALGVEDIITSPTFTIFQIYEGRLPLYHMDVYRLAGIGSDYDLEEYIYGEGVSVIEWYRHIKDSLPKDKLVIDLQIISETKRKLTIEGSGRYEKVVKALSN